MLSNSYVALPGEEFVDFTQEDNYQFLIPRIRAEYPQLANSTLLDTLKSSSLRTVNYRIFFVNGNSGISEVTTSVQA